MNERWKTRCWIRWIWSENGLVPPEAAAIAFVRYHFDINSTKLVERIRDTKSVLIVPGDHFGLDKFIRISYGLPHDYLTAGLDRIHQAIMELGD